MTRYSVKDKVHFIEIAYGSLMEVMSQLEVAEEEQYISADEFHNMECLVADTARLLSGLQRSFLPQEPKPASIQEPLSSTQNSQLH